MTRTTRPSFSITGRTQADLRQGWELDGVTEVLLEHTDLARIGNLDTNQVRQSAAEARNRGLKTVLVWDLLLSDREIADGGALIRSLDLSHFDAIRVQDPGVATYVRDAFPTLERQLVLETGNHNLVGIRRWIEAFEPNRIVLSNELPMPLIRSIREALDADDHTVTLEYLALGRLLIFFTPRKLISPVEPETDEWAFIERFATSVDEGKHFPLVENTHGTFMFYEKDLFLVPYLEEIAAAGIDVARFDLKHFEADELIPALESYLREPSAQHLGRLKSQLAPRLTRGFFKSNRTDKQFVKLKNQHLVVPEQAQLVGTVVETRKKKYLALMTELPFGQNDLLEFIAPEGHVAKARVEWIRDVAGNEHDSAESTGLWMVNHVGKVSAGSRVYRLRES